jgi:hypothetical protein
MESGGLSNSDHRKAPFDLSLFIYEFARRNFHYRICPKDKLPDAMKSNIWTRQLQKIRRFIKYTTPRMEESPAAPATASMTMVRADDPSQSKCPLGLQPTSFQTISDVKRRLSAWERLELEDVSHCYNKK